MKNYILFYLIICLYCIIYFTFFFIFSGKLPSLNHFIKHYTPAEYDRDGLLEQHRRMRRDTATSNQRLQSPLRLTIATPHRLELHNGLILNIYYDNTTLIL